MNHAHYRLGHEVEYTDKPIAKGTAAERVTRPYAGWLFAIHDDGTLTVETEQGTLQRVSACGVRFVEQPSTRVNVHVLDPASEEPTVRKSVTAYRRMHWPECQGLSANISHIEVSMAIYFDPPLANKIDPPGMV
ncbi:MAG: hypothetical protein M0Q95_19870 [Porticoccaceae bacterium]|nr:hypothetical protein [Porticoccaceae bacterium]